MSTAKKVSKYGVISGPNTGKYGPEITPYLDTFHAVVKLSDTFLKIVESFHLETVKRRNT